MNRTQRIVFSLLLVALIASAAYAQTPTPKVEAKTTALSALTAKDYTELLTKLKGGDLTIDFAKLRMAFTATKDYSYNGLDSKERSKMSNLVSDKDYKGALKAAEKILKSEYVNLNAQYVAYVANTELKNTDKAEFHKAVLLGLLSSIKQNNDGLSVATPYYVITIEEEYAVLRFLGLMMKSQSLQHADGHTFDVFTVVDGKTKKESKLYFNIDRVWKAETELFSN